MKNIFANIIINNESKINFVVLIVISGFVCAYFFHYYLGIYELRDYPYNTFLFDPRVRFTDFYGLYDINNNLAPYTGKIRSDHYPFLNLVCYFFTFFDKTTAFILYLLFLTTSFSLLAFQYLKNNDLSLSLIRMIALTFMTYPLLITIDRGNLEGLLAVFIFLFVYFYQKDRHKLGAIFLTLAIALKIFPLVLLVILASDRKYHLLISVIFSAFLLNIISLLVFDGSAYDNIVMLLSGVNFDNNHNFKQFADNNNMVQKGVSLFTFFKIIFNYTNLINVINMSSFLKIYKLTAILAFILISLYILLVETRRWCQFTLLAISMLILPHISADYKLLHIIPPTLLFLRAEKLESFNVLFTLLFSLLLIPKDYIWLYKMVSDASYAHDISVSVILNPILLLSIMFLIIFTGIKHTSLNAITVRYKEQLYSIKNLFYIT